MVNNMIIRKYEICAVNYIPHPKKSSFKIDVATIINVESGYPVALSRNLVQH